MPRRILNRKEPRASPDIAKESERRKSAPKKGASAKAAAKPARTVARKPPKIVRLRAFWAVCNESMDEVALFDYGRQAEAQQRAAELTASKKRSHFVRLVKKPIEE